MDSVQAALAAAMEAHPLERAMQVITNALRAAGKRDVAMFYVEDDVLVAALRAYATGGA